VISFVSECHCHLLVRHEIPVAIGITREPKHPWPLKFLAYLVVLCLKRQCPKPNTFANLESKYLGPPKILGWLHHCQ